MCLTRGRENNCSVAGGGGVTRWAIIDRADILSATVDSATNAVTGLVLDVGKHFWAFKTIEEVTRFKEDWKTVNSTTIFNQSLDTQWQNRTQSDRNSLIELARCSRCGFVIVHEEESGTCWIWGINPDKPTVTEKYTVRLGDGKTDTGVKLEDINASDITLIAKTVTPATEFTPGFAGVPLT